MKKILIVLLCWIMAVSPVFSAVTYAAEVPEEERTAAESSWNNAQEKTEYVAEVEIPETEEAPSIEAENETEVLESELSETEAAIPETLEPAVVETEEPASEYEITGISEEVKKSAGNTVQTLRSASQGIANNGLGGIWIDVNNKPYSDAWATDIAYTDVGCTWFVAARVKELTGKSNFPTVYGCNQWWEWYGESLGFTKGTATPICKSVIVYYNAEQTLMHVAILEKIEGNTAYISEGGRKGLAQNGYTTIRSMSVADLTNGVGFQGCGNFVGYVYMNECPFDREPPTFHGKAKAYLVGTNGAQFVFEASDNIGITNYTIKVWKYGQNESQAVDFTGRVQEFSYDGSKFYSVRMSTSDFSGFEGPYHVACYVYDAAGNQAIAFAKDYISFYECTPGSKVTGTYVVSKDGTPERCAPYASVNGEDTKIAAQKKGEKISVVGAYTNDLGNLWYQTGTGSWIYSENFEHYNWFMEQINNLKKLFEKVIFYWCGMAVQKDAALDVASQLSDAMKSTNYALIDVSVIRRVAEEVANAFSYSTITFDANGGSCGVGQLTYVTGSAFGSLPVPYRFGYTFDGWFTAPEDGAIVTADSICGGSQTLYAHWTRIILLEGWCGDDLYFILYGDGIMEVTGSGEMTSHPWTNNYAKRVLEVNLPDELTGICEAAFKGCEYLEIINIPNQVDEIRSEVFYGCTYLENITLPEAVTYIGHHAFYYCVSLPKIVIPDQVTKIGNSAFEGCKSLAEVTLSNNLVEMKERVFANCTALTAIEIPASLDYCTHYTGGIDDQGPFTGCSGLKDVTFEDGITVIPEGVFAGCTGIERIEIPSTVTEIERWSFANCPNLAEVTISGPVTEIGSGSFCGDTALTSIELPDSVEALYDKVFYGCSSLASVKLSKRLTSMGLLVFAENPALTEIVIPKDLKTCGHYSGGIDDQGPFHHCPNLKKASFATGTTVIAEGVFAGCEGIEEIVIPDTVTEILKWAFPYCTNLAKVTIGDSVTEIGSGAFCGDTALTEIELPDSVTDLYNKVFYGCTNLAEVKLSKRLKHMGMLVFSNDTALTKIVIPKRLDYCDYYAGSNNDQGPFHLCPNLKEVIFEDGTTIIAAAVLAGCEGIEEVVIPDSVVELEKWSFAYCTNLSKVTMSANVQEIGSGTFYNDSKLREMILPESMIALYGPCFYGTGITQIRIPGGITNIPDEAFRKCAALEQIDWSLADSLKTIGTNAFRDCSSLTEAVIPVGVTGVYSYAFYNCDAMTKVVLPESVTTLGSYAFADCGALTDVTLSKGLTTLEASLFEGCDVLESLIVPRRVTAIRANVFKNAPKFKSITIPKSVTSIQTSAFSYPHKLTIYGVAGSYAETFANDNDITFISQEIPAEDVSLSETNLELIKNASKTLYLTIKPEDFTDDIVWKSTNTSVATVSETGVVKAIGAGTAVIKVSVGDITVTCNVTVLQPVTGISLSQTSATMEVEDAFLLTATVYPSNATNKTLNWSSSDENIASVEENGWITANAVGTATITAAATDGSGVKATCRITVQKTTTIYESISDLPVTLSKTSYTYDGKAKEPIVTVKNGDAILTSGTDYTVTYADNINAGTATVKVTGTGNYKGEKSVTFTINKANAMLAFAESTVTKKTTDTAFTNTLIKTTDGTVTFESSNTNVATVNSTSGLVTIKGAGTTTITATASEGKNYKAGSAEYTLTIEAPVPTPTPTPTVTGFSDVQDPTHPYYDAIYWAAEKGITGGYKDGTFGINKACTRGHAVMFLWKMAGAPAPAAVTKAPFSDVPKTHPYYKAVLWAQQKGITKGYTSGANKGKFGIDDTCTRGQIMTFIWNYKGKPAPKSVSKSPFSDVPTTHPYYKAILWGSQNGVTKGYTSGPNAGKFGINDNCTRGQIVKFLYNIR